MGSELRQFKVGERFRITGGIRQNIDQGLEGLCGVVIRVGDSNNNYSVKLENGHTYSDWNNDGDMELIPEETRPLMETPEIAELPDRQKYVAPTPRFAPRDRSLNYSEAYPIR